MVIHLGKVPSKDRLVAWIFRNKTNICAGLAAVSIVLGAASVTGWFQSLEALFLLVGTCILVFLAVILIFTIRIDVPLDQARYISGEVGDSVLRLALGCDKHPQVCVNLAASHAMAAAIASLVVHNIAGYVQSLRDQFDVCVGELRMETTFTVEKLDEHMDILLDLNSRLNSLVGEQALDPSASGDPLRRIFCSLPEGYRLLHEDLREVQIPLETEIIRDMRLLRGSDCNSPSVQWRNELEQMLRTKADRLEGLCARVDRVLEQLTSIVRAIRKDWSRDIQQLRRDKMCIPAAPDKHRNGFVAAEK